MGFRVAPKGKITPDFYSGQCPLIDNDVAVLAPGGKALMIGVRCSDGEILWRTPNPDSLLMSHGSIMPMVIHGRKMYVYNAVGGVVVFLLMAMMSEDSCGKQRNGVRQQQPPLPFFLEIMRSLSSEAMEPAEES